MQTFLHLKSRRCTGRKKWFHKKIRKIVSIQNKQYILCKPVSWQKYCMLDQKKVVLECSGTGRFIVCCWHSSCGGRVVYRISVDIKKQEVLSLYSWVELLGSIYVFFSRYFTNPFIAE